MVCCFRKSCFHHFLLHFTKCKNQHVIGHRSLLQTTAYSSTQDNDQPFFHHNCIYIEKKTCSILKTISIVLLDNLLCLLFEEILLDFPLPVIRTHYLTCIVQNYIPLCPRLSDTGFLCVHIKKIIGIGFPSIAAINLLHL